METPYPTLRGSPTPLGASRKNQGVNFALFSSEATTITLCLFNPTDGLSFAEIPLNPKLNRTGNIWHILVKNLPEKFDYGFRVSNLDTLLADPYATALDTPYQWGEAFFETHQLLSRFDSPPDFDWQEDSPPNIPLNDLIIYEMHVRGFTKHPSSHTKNPGKFLGIIEKIPYLKELGVNALELLPIFEFNESENALNTPTPLGNKLQNYWGYSTLNFFCATNRYAFSCSINEFKALVKELHKNHIELILDVVYNHTAEGNEKGRTLSFKGLDKSTYYLLSPEGHYLNFSGCGNTLNCNHPVVIEFILDSLRYWAGEMHVDGFRFDLASILTRDMQGVPMHSAPVIEAISKDPILANCKLIAEAWDAAGLYQVGSFPAYGRWAEWNGKYRDTVRKFIKGTAGVAGNFSRALAGSQDLYGYTRNPSHSVNFITAHDGFTLRDLVSYNHKHNEANGENNQDGTDDNESWNCGYEGVSHNPHIVQLRERQMRNFHTALMVSLGTPMLLMGDEYGHSTHGNNNMWSQDAPNWFEWNKLEKAEGFHRFYKKMIAFRKNTPLLRRSTFFTDADVDWHGHLPFQAQWGEESRFVAYTLKDLAEQHHLYIAFNADGVRPCIQLPPPPFQKQWYLVVDTALASPCDFIEEPQKNPCQKTSYRMETYSAIILQAF